MAAEASTARRYRLLWIGRAGFGVVWRGVEHQFYRDLDGSMGKPWTHQNNGPWAIEDERRFRDARSGFEMYDDIARASLVNHTERRTL